MVTAAMIATTVATGPAMAIPALPQSTAMMTGLTVHAQAPLATKNKSSKAKKAKKSKPSKKAKKAGISRLQITVAGAPRGQVKIRGPRTHLAVTQSSVLRVRTGKYNVHAANVLIDGDSYIPDRRTWKVKIRRGTATVVTVRYAHVGSSSETRVGNDTPPAGELGSVFTLVNQARSRTQQCGPTTMPPADPVIYDSELAEAAQAHAQDMDARNYFEHDSLDGRTFIDRINATDYDGDPAAENIAMGFQNAADVVQGWLQSPGHCLNLMDPEYDEMGLGFASHTDARYSIPVTYWVQDFGYAPDFK